MTDSFCNPYHFVPVTRQNPSPEQNLEVTDFDKRKLKNYSHAKYHADTLSGRIICKLTTEKEIFVGAAQTRLNPKEVAIAEHFELEGKPAIPASSLRGLLSSLVESASHSALRVLDDRVLSVRQEVEEALSAIGMVVCQTNEQGEKFYRLNPLTLPKEFHHDLFRGLSPLRIYLSDKNHSSLLKNNTSFNIDSPQYFYANLHSIVKPKKDVPILTFSELKKLPIDEQRHHTRGILRILGTKGRKDMADTKEYDLFIPYSDTKEKQTNNRKALIPILPEAIERFEQLADERTEATKDESALDILPYHPLGTLRNSNSDPNDHRLRLKTGDLVYFKPALDKNGKVVITDISFSSVWRTRIETKERVSASVHHFFKQINPELLPFNDGRNLITPAELLFGFVQKDTRASSDKGRALAGRVNVSFGILSPEQSTPYYQNKVVLKSLLSPKPPCPITYFKESAQGEECITKRTLDPTKHVPQGRKMYLHAHQDNGEQPWKTVDSEKNKSLKTAIRPLKPKRIFYFHLDFYNLSRWELGLLFYALRPTDAFRHKLGMGKAIGLGTVRIDPIGLFLIDRKERYSRDDIFNSRRYHQIFVEDAIPKELYPQEHVTSYVKRKVPKWQELRDEFVKTMLPDVKNALELLGDPSKVAAKVMVPTIYIKKPEDENFKWFEENYGEQQLQPLNEKSCKIPTLLCKKE